MATTLNDADLHALKIAFSYMPQRIEVTRYEYGERYEKVLAHIDTVREVLISHGVDPEEVYGDIHSDIAPNSSY
jgi:hypothetical protein